MKPHYINSKKIFHQVTENILFFRSHYMTSSYCVVNARITGAIFFCHSYFKVICEKLLILKPFSEEETKGKRVKHISGRIMCQWTLQKIQCGLYELSSMNE
jgi:hypothetical protein